MYYNPSTANSVLTPGLGFGAEGEQKGVESPDFRYKWKLKIHVSAVQFRPCPQKVSLFCSDTFLMFHLSSVLVDTRLKELVSAEPTF